MSLALDSCIRWHRVLDVVRVMRSLRAMVLCDAVRCRRLVTRMRDCWTHSWALVGDTEAGGVQRSRTCTVRSVNLLAFECLRLWAHAVDVELGLEPAELAMTIEDCVSSTRLRTTRCMHVLHVKTMLLTPVIRTVPGKVIVDSRQESDVICFVRRGKGRIEAVEVPGRRRREQKRCCDRASVEHICRVVRECECESSLTRRSGAGPNRGLRRGRL